MYPGILFGTVQQIQLRTEGRENGDLGGGCPLFRGSAQFAMSETHILIRLLWMYFPWNWEFGSALSKLRIFFFFFWGGGELPLGTPLGMYKNQIFKHSRITR
jgi:hypothetical protein